MNETSRLTEEGQWESIYADQEIERLPSLDERPWYKRNFAEYFLWEVLFRRFLPQREGLKVLDVGSAPGVQLIKLWRKFGYEPFGVEYTENGALLNRKLFERYSLDPANVIHGDFFSRDFQEPFRGFFDVVISRGFIEHFSDPRRVVKDHVDLLNDKGTLVVTVPNFRGINGFLQLFFNKADRRGHNLDIMSRKPFADLFDGQGLSRLFCDYYGAFSFSLFNAPSCSFRSRLLHLLDVFQLFLNPAFHVAFRRGGGRSSVFSPSLAYIGKRASSADPRGEAEMADSSRSGR